MITKEEVYNYIVDTKYVSCINLYEKFGEGDYILERSNNKIITAFGLSKELADILIELLNEGMIFDLPCEKFVYIIDGATLNDKNWIPCTFDNYQISVSKIKSRKNIKNDDKVLLINNIRRKKNLPEITNINKAYQIK